MKINCKTILIRNSEIPFTTLNDISDVKVGIQTGDNKFYLCKEKGAYGPYQVIDKSKVLSVDNIKNLIMGFYCFER